MSLQDRGISPNPYSPDVCCGKGLSFEISRKELLSEQDDEDLPASFLETIKGLAEIQQVKGIVLVNTKIMILTDTITDEGEKEKFSNLSSLLLELEENDGYYTETVGIGDLGEKTFDEAVQMLAQDIEEQGGSFSFYKFVD